MSGGAAAPRGGLLARNAGLNLVGQGLPLLVALGSMPFIVRGLGPERFGLLAIAWMLLGYFGALGFGKASTKFAAETMARGETATGLAPLVWTTAALQACIGLAVGALLLWSTPALTERVLRMPPELVAEAGTAFRLLAVAVPVVLAGTAFKGVLEAAQRFDLTNAIHAPASAASFLLPLVALAAGWSLPGILLLLLASRSAAALAAFALAVRLYPVLWRDAGRLAAAELRRVAGFAGWVTVSGLVSPALVYLDRVLLAALVGVGAVAYYAAPYELVTRLLILPAALVATLFPAFSALAGRSDWERVERYAARSVKAVLLVLGPVVVLLLAGAHDLLGAWLGPDYAAEGALALRILAVGVLINALAYVAVSLLQGIGHPELPARLHLAELPVHALLVWILVSVWGVAGAALAWTIRVALDAGLLFLLVDRVAPDSRVALRRDQVPRTAALLATALAAGAAAAWLPFAWQRLGAAALLAALTLLTTWRFALGAVERAELLRRLHRERAGAGPSQASGRYTEAVR